MQVDNSPATLAEKVNAYLRLAADECGLRDVEVVWNASESAADDAEAEIEVFQGQRAAVVFRGDFFTRPPEEQRRVIAHEICHIPFDRLANVFSCMLEIGDSKLLAYFCQVGDCGVEFAVEHFARLLAPTLPLPEFVGP